MKKNFWDIIIKIIGAPLIISLAVWSLFPEPILNINAPTKQSMIVALIAYSIGLFLLMLRHDSRMYDNIKIIMAAVENPSRIYNGKKASISQVDQMLEEVNQLLKKGERIVILEGHFEPNPPKNNMVLESHINLVKTAAENNFNLCWKVLVGQSDSQKDVWISNLKKEVQFKSKSKYQVIELKNLKPSLNFMVIPELNQTYFGFGDWLGEDSTGGIWIKSKHIAGAMSGVFDNLVNPADKNQCNE
jgi:hypothetical protein